MNAPYPELSINLDHRIAAFAEWNAGIERSRREYRLNPFAACGVSSCERLRARGRMCSSHAGPNVRRANA